MGKPEKFLNLKNYFMSSTFQKLVFYYYYNFNRCWCTHFMYYCCEK